MRARKFAFEFNWPLCGAGGYPPELSESIICSCLPKTFLPIVDRSSAIVVESWGPIQLPLFCQVNKESEWVVKEKHPFGESFEIKYFANYILSQKLKMRKKCSTHSCKNSQLRSILNHLEPVLFVQRKKKPPAKNTCSDCFKNFWIAI